MEKLKKLYETLKLRKRPEDIAQMVKEVLEADLSYSELKIIDKAAKNSLKRNFFNYTSMAQEFSKVVGAEKRIKKIIEIFELEEIENINPNHIPDIKNFIATVSPLIYKKVGGNNFLSDRLNKDQRKEIGLDISKRRYNKKWRLLKKLENKLIKYQRELRKKEFQLISKHGIVHNLEYDEFKKDKNTACFIAYYNARCNLRSVFTNGSQTRAFDEISEMLFNRCKTENLNSKNKTNWLAISYLYTGQNVLSNLTDKQKGELLGKWTSILQEISILLDEVWKKSNINRKTMIVKRGNDSTTWNNTAGAWNKARDQWMNLIYSLGLESILNDICFGKVMRLMAGDVAFWHFKSGGNLDPNTEVWNKLPLPWEVFNKVAFCNKDLVIKYCNDAGINAEKSGWIAPRIHGIERYPPTPELVHGVQISNPFLASILKKHKCFSGKV